MEHIGEIKSKKLEKIIVSQLKAYLNELRDTF